MRLREETSCGGCGRGASLSHIKLFVLGCARMATLRYILRFFIMWCRLLPTTWV